jgi:ribonuclease BN (tRNA processing enzyme)
MRINVLGAHNSESKNTRYISLLVDGILALDAGGLTSGLSFEDQAKLRGILLTHHHYDHMRDIPALAINLFLRSRQIDVYSHQAVFDNLSQHFLNGTLYPEYQKRPEGNPVLRFHMLAPLSEVLIEGYRIKPVPMNHSQPTMGYELIAPDNKRIFYTGDTGSGLSEVWRQIQPQLLFIEVTAPDQWRQSMMEHKHLTPSLLKEELMAFRESKGYLPRIVAVHMNPQSEKEIASELEAVAASVQADIKVAYEGLQIEL